MVHGQTMRLHIITRFLQTQLFHRDTARVLRRAGIDHAGVCVIAGGLLHRAQQIARGGHRNVRADDHDPSASLFARILALARSFCWRRMSSWIMVLRALRRSRSTSCFCFLR